ncbi:Ubiquitin-like-specific protease 1 [Linum perenne]
MYNFVTDEMKLPILPLTIVHGLFYFFKTYAASGVQTPEQAYENYWLSFLHNAEQCKKVFVPMNDNRTHWYLAVIIFNEKKVHMVDSDPSPSTHENRVCAIKTMMDFMSELFHIIYAKASQQGAPKISEFDVIVPHGIARQPNGYDCGLWVCLWIINANTTNKYNIDVGDSTRMHLALNLVMSFKNYIRETITRRSIERWKRMDKQGSAMQLFM